MSHSDPPSGREPQLSTDSHSVEAARRRAAEQYYRQAQGELARLDRQRAVELLESALALAPGYTDAKELLAEVEEARARSWNAQAATMRQMEIDRIERRNAQAESDRHFNRFFPIWMVCGVLGAASGGWAANQLALRTTLLPALTPGGWWLAFPIVAGLIAALIAAFITDLATNLPLPLKAVVTLGVAAVSGAVGGVLLPPLAVISVISAILMWVERRVFPSDSNWIG